MAMTTLNSFPLEGKLEGAASSHFYKRRRVYLGMETKQKTHLFKLRGKKKKILVTSFDLLY